MPDKLLEDFDLIAAVKESATTRKEKWVRDSTGHVGGRLWFRARPTVDKAGKLDARGTWIFLYSPGRGAKPDRLAFGAYIPKRRAGGSDAKLAGAAYTLAQAREKAAEFGRLLKVPATRNIRAYLTEQEAAAEARRRAESEQREREARIREQAEHYTLKRLIEVYVADLRRRGRKCAGAAEGVLRLHVLEAFPVLAKAPAAALTNEQATLMVRKLVSDGKERSAGILRSYLHAAFELAANAPGDADAPADALGFGIEHNPIHRVKVKSGKSRARTRTLNETEVQRLLHRLHEYGTPAASAVLIALHAGGQRPEQLLETRYPDWDAGNGKLRLHDYKGKRREPRIFVLPLPAIARTLMAEATRRSIKFYETRSDAPLAAARYVFPSYKRGGGIGRIHLQTVSDVIADISRKMVGAEESVEPFQLKDLRRTVENLLIRDGVPKEVRARLMSHGVSGVQDQHYVAEEEFMPEYRKALDALERRLAIIESAGQRLTLAGVV